MLSKIKIGHAPHVNNSMSTRSVMLDVVIGLMPAVVAASWLFRFQAGLLIGTCIASAVITEWLCNIIRKKPNSLGDFSAVITGLILALSLPPSLPLWAAVIGSCFSIAIGKMVFGGLGANIFNPAMVGRAFLTACFGVMMTTWTIPSTIDSSMPYIGSGDSIDARTQATPLAQSKAVIKGKSDSSILDNQSRSLFFGNTGGCLGETSSLALLLGAAYLFIRKTINFHIPLSILLSSFIFGLIAHLIDPQLYINPLLHLTSGGMLLCVFFIATDPVGAPVTKRGMWLFGAGVGTLIMLIRIVGEYPEGIMFAILLMNAVSPLIDKLCKRIPAGGLPNVQ